MNPLEKLFSELEQKTVTASADDGFPSAEFRCMVLNELKKIKLGRAPRGNYWNPNYNTVEKIKIDYFTDAGNIGENLAQKYLAAKILLPSEHFLRSLINTGLKFIGSEIARVYALEIYPELRLRRLAGERDLEVPSPEKAERKPPSFGFMVETDRNIYDLGPVKHMTSTPGSHVYYDDICDRHTETFVFASVDDADAAHWNWERFVKHQTPRPPVRYAIRIETGAADEIAVSTVVHADLFEQSHSEFTPDGSSVEWRVCDSVEEAENLRLEKLKERAAQSAASSAKLPVWKDSQTHSRGRNRNRNAKGPETPSVTQKKSKNKNLSISK